MIIALVLVNSVFSQMNYSTEDIRRITHMLELLKENKVYEAVYEMNAFLAGHPKDASIYMLRGGTFYTMGDIYKARRDYKKAVELDASRASSRYVKSLLSRKYMAEILAEGYISVEDLDSSNNYRPIVTLKDTLQGSLRSERTCFDVNYYDLTVKIFPESKSIEGSNTIYFSSVDTTERIQIDLFENYDILSIKWINKELDHERICNAVFIDFPEMILPGEEHEITIQYSGIPREAPKPPWNGGFVWKKFKRRHWIGVACEHLGASSWWPNKDHLSDKPDSVRINVQVPTGYQAIANGNLRTTKEIEEGYTNFEWFVSYPINNYNVTLYVGDFINFHETFENDSSSYRLDYYVMKKNLKKARKYYEQTKDVFMVFEKLFGEYPFKNDGAAMVEAPYRGMEHQSAIAIGGDYGKTKRRNYKNTDYDYLVVHEAAHEWWGNAVAIGDMADAWINEGFATYAEHLFMEEMFGYEEYISASAANMSIIFDLWPIVGRRGINDNTFLGGDIYHKGAAMLNNLRCIIDNDTLFFKIIKDFYSLYKFKITSTNDFVNLVHDYTGNDYTAFFNKFLYDEEPPVLFYNFSIVQGKLLLYYKWINVDKDFTMPFCITLNDKESIRLTGNTQMQSFSRDKVSSFYMPNAYHYDKYLVAPNSFTYYWTSWE